MDMLAWHTKEYVINENSDVVIVTSTNGFWSDSDEPHCRTMWAKNLTSGLFKYHYLGI